jgi:POT family proton-dependent oligopeptide transporter
MTSAAIPARDRDLFGHPRGLTVLFLTETWAQFSYYGMQAMLVYYMTKQLHYSQPAASGLYGGYVAFAYLTPLLGGVLADRWLGQGRSVVLGGSLMAAGHFALAFQSLFFPGLFLVGLGNGFFLPSTTTQVGYLYKPGDSRRDRAYSLYYVGVNIGGFLAPLVCGTIGELYGWHYGFAIAGVGMLAGLVIYLTNRRLLPAEAQATKRGAPRPAPLGPEARRAVRNLLAIAATVVLFRIAYEQTGNTIALWADARTDRVLRLAGHAFLIPATWFQSINPFLIFALTPVVTWRWARQAGRGREPSPLRKMAMGSALGGLSFLLMIGAAIQAGDHGQAHWLWLVAFFALLTCGELYVLPIGLSVFSQLAPAQVASAMVGVWFLAKFAGGLCSGWLGAYWQVLPPATFFAVGAVFALLAAAGLALADRWGVLPKKTPSAAPATVH